VDQNERTPIAASGTRNLKLGGKIGSGDHKARVLLRQTGAVKISQHFGV
jgi:hypothetical protein